MNTELYLEFISKTLETDGIKVADTANKIALDKKEITIKQYSKAARLIVRAYMAQ